MSSDGVSLCSPGPQPNISSRTWTKRFPNIWTPSWRCWKNSARSPSSGGNAAPCSPSPHRPPLSFSLATFLINTGKDVKTIQGLLRHAKSSTTLDLYSQAIDASKLAAQRDIALAITSNQVQANWKAALAAKRGPKQLSTL